MSIDGYIADENGGIDWLPMPEDNEDWGYHDFISNIGYTFMGNSTFQQVRTFGNFPYSELTNYVISRTKQEAKDYPVEFVCENIPDFVRELKSKAEKDIWCIGGAKVNSMFLENNLLDELYLTIIPKVLGAGRPLFEGQKNWTEFNLDRFEDLGQGIIALRYSK